MNVATPALKQLNRTFIGSVLFIDIVGYSRRTVPDQLAMKELFNRVLADAVQNVAASERIMVDTGDGAAIAFLGDPEDALFAALSLRDAFDTGHVKLGEPGFVRMGINLGPLRIVRDINGHTNMIGDGVNDAQRVMSFAEPGQVIVSHSYYDIISRFSRDYAQLFVYEGTRHDKHVREHEVYRFGPASDNQDLAERLRDRSRARHVNPPETATRQGQNVMSSLPSFGTKIGSRAGLFATLIGATTIVGAVWSWSDSPAPPGTVVPPPAAMQSSDIAPAEPNIATVADGNPAAKAPASAKPAAKPGTVKLAIRPWGEIYVNGSQRGVSPPLKSLSLPPGKYKVEVRNGEFTPYKTSIEVKSGDAVTVHYRF